MWGDYLFIHLFIVILLLARMCTVMKNVLTDLCNVILCIPASHNMKLEYNICNFLFLPKLCLFIICLIRVPHFFICILSFLSPSILFYSCVFFFFCYILHHFVRVLRIILHFLSVSYLVLFIRSVFLILLHVSCLYLRLVSTYLSFSPCLYVLAYLCSFCIVFTYVYFVYLYT